VILGTGVDLAEVGRIQASIERYGERFTRRVFTEREIAYAERKANKYERYAARFAAKEAGLKALGTGWSGGITWKDLEVTNLSSGRPTLALHGVARDVAGRLGVKTIHLSLTHTSAEAMAWVVLEA
jgi:holo-[acyl-carrier protein] synthase